MKGVTTKYLHWGLTERLGESCHTLKNQIQIEPIVQKVITVA